MFKKLILCAAALLLCSSGTVFAAEQEGIDVSNYQGNINWEAVAGDGVEFAIIKATEGSTYTDAYFEQNVAGAQENGIAAGAYHFARFSSVAQAEREADFFLQTISGVELDYIAALDLETTNGAGANTLTNGALAFLRKVEEAGYTAFIYSSESFYQTYLDQDALSDYGFWVAKFSSSAPAVETDIWQYSESGTVSGISGGVDMNTAYDDFSTDGNGGSNTGGNSGGNSGNNGAVLSASEIRSIQRTLNARYGTSLAVDGLYGPRTHSALVRGIQTEINRQFGGNLAVDGIYGTLSRQSFAYVRYGASGNMTYLIQSMLALQGYDPGTIDGIFGSNTLSAVRAFQSAKGLSVDGIVGINTAYALFQ